MKRIFIAGAFILFAAVVQAQNVGIGVPIPLQKLDVNGAIRFGNTGTNNAGTLRYSSGRFEGYDGFNWNWLNGFKLPLDTSVNVAGGYVLNIYNNNSTSPQSSAIAGITSSTDGAGVYGENTNTFSSSGIAGNGVLGRSSGEGAGVKGIHNNGIGVEGTGGAVGVYATSDLGNGLEAFTKFGIAMKATVSGGLSGSGTGLDISAANNASSTAAIFRHPRIDGKAFIVEQGFVGIGEVSPTALLSVKGSEVTANGFAAAITLQNSASTNRWYMRAGGPGTITPDGGFSIADNTNYRLVIGATGNIGIGIAPSTAKLDVNGGVKIQGINALEFGAGVAGKEINAGKIGYQTFTPGALDIVGAGTLVSNRKVNIFAEGGTTFNGPINVGGSTGTTGQVLTSNGAAAPTWANTALSNDVRFEASFSGFSSSLLDPLLNYNTVYNLNLTAVSISGSGITVNRSGLYHIEGEITTDYVFVTPPSFLVNDIYLHIDGRPYTQSRYEGTNRDFIWPSYRYVKSIRFVQEVYIGAPGNIDVDVFTHIIGGNFTNVNNSGKISGYLISD